MDEGFYTGLNLTLTGRIWHSSTVDTPVIVRGVWSKTNPPSDLTADPRVTLVAPKFMLGRDGIQNHYVSYLTIDSLDMDKGDSGDYTLSVSISSVPFTIGTSVNRTRTITVLGKIM